MASSLFVQAMHVNKVLAGTWRRLALTPGALAFICAIFSYGTAQQSRVTITVFPDSNRARIEGNCAATKRWSFLDSYAGILGLGSRIEHFAVSDDQGGEVPSRKIAPGEFESTSPATNFQYEVDLKPNVRLLDSARVSWLTRDRGLFLLKDLLPLESSKEIRAHPTLVTFRAPEPFAVYSEEEPSSNGFVVANLERAVFGLGTRIRTSRAVESGMTFTLIADGDWAFSDNDVLEMIGKVLKSHRQVFGGMPAIHGALILLHFPQSVGPGEWSAETRGSTVILLLGKLPSKVGALAQLSTPLTHELFHLWVPNVLALEGDYDWFYEGFTVYQAARTAVRLDLLTFSEFLNAIARAYDASTTTANALSLIEASGRRWTTGQSSVYSKSLVVAFLYDLRVRSASHGKQSLDNAYRNLFEKYSAGKGANTDGNTASIEALAFNPTARDFLERFIRRPVTINLATELLEFGLQVETVGLRTRISVSEKLNKHQRDLLRELGYNDVVRSPRR